MEALLLALTLGLAAGLSPGPLLTLVVTATLARGFGAGLRVAMAPLVTDVPIVFLVLLVLDRLPPTWLAALSIVGGVFVLLIGILTWREQPPDLTAEAAATGSKGDLGRGVLVNFLSPHPWIAWATILGPQVVALWQEARPVAVGFVTLFYLLLVGSKVAIAALVARGRRHLDAGRYRLVLRACAVLLLLFGVLLVVDGVRTVTAG